MKLDNALFRTFSPGAVEYRYAPHGKYYQRENESSEQGLLGGSIMGKNSTSTFATSATARRRIVAIMQAFAQTSKHALVQTSK